MPGLVEACCWRTASSASRDCSTARARLVSPGAPPGASNFGMLARVLAIGEIGPQTAPASRQALLARALHLSQCSRRCASKVL